MSDEEQRDEKIQELVDERVEKLREDLKKEAQKETEKLRKEVERLKTQNNTTTQNTSEKSGKQGISRRSFLKKAGLGTAGLAALMSPVSAFDVKSDTFDVMTSPDNGSTLNTGLFVGENGGVQIPNGNLDMTNNNLERVNQINGTNVSDLGGGDVNNPLQNNLDAGDNKIFNLSGLELPNTSNSNNNHIWVDESSRKLKAKIQGTVFTVGTAIPDSVVLDYHLGEEPGQTLSDEVEGATATVENTPTWVSDSTSLGGYYLDITGDGDATGEIEVADSDRSFSDLMSTGATGEAGFAFSVEFDTFSDYAARFGAAGNRAYIADFGSGLAVGAGDDTKSTGFNPTIGTRYRLAVFWDNNNGDWKFYVDAGTPQASGNFNGTADFSGVWKIIRDSIEANVSSFCFFDSYASNSDVQADYDRLPWS